MTHRRFTSEPHNVRNHTVTAALTGLTVLSASRHSVSVPFLPETIYCFKELRFPQPRG